MRSPELDAVRHARARRKRLTRTLLATTGGVGLVTVASFLVLPGVSPFRARTVAAPEVPSAAPPAVPEVPVVQVRGGTVAIDGVVIAQTAGIERLQKIDPLYQALVQRRADWRFTHQGDPPRRVVLDVDTDTPAIVVKSVFQTAAFAGYPDVVFKLPDGGMLGPQR
jgi:hypothetical protein